VLQPIGKWGRPARPIRLCDLSKPMNPSYFNFFIAGIIQGSSQDDNVHDQNYRKSIRKLLENEFPLSRVYCPVENHPDSVQYNDANARSVFMGHIDQVRNADCVIVYLPQASMGSAIEMWEAHHYGTVVICISPMKTNWVVRLFSDAILNNLDEFGVFVQSGRLQILLNQGRKNEKH
jgi:hypothetical protein